MTKAAFTRLDHSTREDWLNIAGEFMHFAQGLPNRIAAHLALLNGDFGGFPVDRYTHSLQTGTRALRDGRDDEYVACALLHDIVDTLCTFKHPYIAAAMLQPFVSDENLWMVKHHGIFQGHYFFHHLGMDRDMRDQLRNHPCYDRTEEFCECYDNPAFDEHYDTLPIVEFMPILQRVFASPRRSLYKQAMERRAS